MASASLGQIRRVPRARPYNYVGLSALCDSSQILLIGVLPYTTKQPQEYGLIEITKSKKNNLVNKKLNMVEPALVIDEWEPLKSYHRYKDVPYEKGIVQKVLKENLIPDEQISSSLQCPIISAPKVFGSIGGIALSSMMSDSKFANDFLKTIQLMVPPEYRDLPPPKSVYEGDKFQYRTGIKFHLAERPHHDNNILSTIYAKQYNRLSGELSRRYEFNGEFSICSALNPDKGNVNQMLVELFKNFTATFSSGKCTFFSSFSLLS